MIKRLFAPILVALALPIGLGLVWNTTVWIFVDGWAFLAVPVLGTLYAFLLRGLGPSAAAFAAPFDPGADRAALESSAGFFDLLGRSHLGFGAVASLISLIDMLRNLADRSQVGPRLAVTLIGLLYAALLYILVVLPFSQAARRRLEAGD